MTSNTLKKAVRVLMITVATLSSGSLFQAGCGGDLGGYGDYGYGDYGYGGYGPIDDDVFQSAADDWSSYIRGDYDW